MKYLLILVALFNTAAAQAETLRCERVTEDGKLQKNTVVTIDPVKALLNMQSPSGSFQMPVLTESSVYPYNSPAIWYDRATECTMDTIRVNGAVTFSFQCKSAEGVNTNAALEISADKKSASYTGVILVANSPDQPFSAVFQECR
jgi:hypothetical protein